MGLFRRIGEMHAQIRRAVSKYYLHGTLVVGLLLLCLAAAWLRGPLLPVGMTVGGLLVVGSWAKMTLRGYVGREIEAHDTERRAEALADENARLRADASALAQEVEDLRSRRLKVLNVRPILEMGILEAECQIAECFDLQFDEKGELIDSGEAGGEQRSLWEVFGWWVVEGLTGMDWTYKRRFIGTLYVKFLARYGIDMQRLRVKRDDEKKVLLVANAEPAYLGSKGFPETEWRGCVCLRETKSAAWLADLEAASLESFGKDLGRKAMELVLQKGPECLNWLKGPLKNTVKHLLQMLIAPPEYSVVLVDEDVGGFVPFFDYAALLGLEKPPLLPPSEDQP